DSKEKISETIEEEIPVEKDGAFTLKNVNGRVTVSSWDKPAVSIKAEKIMRYKTGSNGGFFRGNRRNFETDEEAHEFFEELEVEVSSKKDNVSVDAKFPRLSKYHADLCVSYEILVPANALVKVNTTNGKIVCKDLRGGLDLCTTNGAVEAKGVAGAIKAKSTNGGLDIQFSQPPSPGENVSCKTTNGSIKLTLPEASAFDLEASTVNGSLNVDFPVTIGPVSRGMSFSPKISGEVQGGGAQVKLKTINGSISVRKGKCETNVADVPEM
ncbi:DUF4097 domain-containing protein, partial [Candidatus Hydrogenedentota bacterium]